MTSASPTASSHRRRRRGHGICTFVFLLWSLSVTYQAAGAWTAPPTTRTRTKNALRLTQFHRLPPFQRRSTSAMPTSSANTPLYMTATSSSFLNYRNDTTSDAMDTFVPEVPSLRSPRQHIRPPHSRLPSNVHILVLPGFGTDSNDYQKNDSLIPNLHKRGWTTNQVHVLQVARYDWFFHTILQGMIINHRRFMTRQITPLSSCYKWYLQRLSKHVNDITAADPNAKIVLVGHSAGGWLARAAVGYGSEVYKKQQEMHEEISVNDKNRNRNTSTICRNGNIAIDIDRILGIVTLGSPHLPLPINNRGKINMIPDESIMDITGGALRNTNKKFPGAYFHDKLFYITAVGNAVEASPATTFMQSSEPYSVSTSTTMAASTTATAPTAGADFVNSSSSNDNDNGTNTHYDHQSVARMKQMAYHSYKLVSGDGKTCGDGVVPIDYAHLDGAIQINLDSVYHAAELSKCSTWYGSDTIIDQWLDRVVSLVGNENNE